MSLNLTSLPTSNRLDLIPQFTAQIEEENPIPYCKGWNRRWAAREQVYLSWFTTFFNCC